MKTSTKISIKNAIALSSICIASMAMPTDFVPSAFAQYGLGLPKSAGTGGAIRSASLPQIMVLVPRDGAKTLAANPTFYWFIAPPDKSDSVTTDPMTIPNPADSKNAKITFFLRDGNGDSLKTVFKAEGKVDGTGFFKFTLPENAPALVKGRVQRWAIRYEVGTVQIDVHAPIRRDDDPVVLELLASAQNDLEKARIYTKKFYWYDALDAYTSWLDQNPRDDIARTEHRDLLKAGLKNNFDFIKTDADNSSTDRLDPVKLSNFLTKLDESKSAKSIELKSK